MTVSTKLSLVSENIFKVFVTAISHTPWWPCFLTDQVFFLEGHLRNIPVKFN